MADRPNILIFMTDQQQADVVAPDHPCHTPVADRLAAQGVRFRRTFTPAAHCCPSRASFMTGLYPSRHGVYNNLLNASALSSGLKPGVVTFSELLRDAGYELAIAGKWHVSATEEPADRGWTELLVTADTATRHGPTVAQVRAAAATAVDESERRRGTVQRPGWGDFPLYGTIPDGGAEEHAPRSDHALVEAAIEALPHLASEDKPWVLFVGPIGPHDPFVVPQRYLDMYDPASIPLPPNYHDTLADKPGLYRRMRRVWDQLSEDEVRASIAHYWAYCTYEDDLLGRVLDALDATGQADRTLVLFLSDHGEYCGAHGLYLKGVPAFREAYHVPCIARWPEGISAPGRVVDAVVTLADFAPTFLEVAGVDAPSDLTGASLVPFLRDEPPSDWPAAFFSQFNGVELYYSQRVVATDAWKYVYNGFDEDELYDLRNDPHELVNLASDPAFDAIKHALVRQMWQFAAAQDDAMIFSPYGTVALAPWGPLDGLRPER